MTVPRTLPSRRPWAQAATLAVGLFVVYALGAARTIYVGDSGELVAAVHTLGIPHPSGYPLYVLLGKLWTLLLPVGSIAFRMSLFSAACAALACGGLYLVARRLGAGAVAAATGALLLAFSPSFWAEANIQRVYALNALFLVAALAAAIAWHREREPRWLAAAFLLAGLGAANHTFMALFAAVLGLFAAATDPRLLRRPRALAACGGAFAVGLLPYLFLPLRSRQEPRLDWGNPETLPAFLDVVLRRDFWGRSWLQSAADLPPILGDYAGSLGAELLWAGAALAAVGLWKGWRRGAPVALLALVMAANLASTALHGSRSDLFIWHRYYIPSYLAASLLAALGAQWAAERLPGRLHRARWALLALPLALLLLGYPRFDRGRYRLAEDFSRTLMASLPPGTTLAASDDNVLFVLIYLQLVEAVRPDVHLVLQGVGDAHLPPLRFHPERDPLFFTHHPNWQVPALEVMPSGLAYRIQAAAAPPPPLVIPKRRLEGELDPRVPKDYLTQNLIGHFHFMLAVSHEARGDWPAAARELAEAAAAAPDNDVLFYNLGLIYRRNGRLEQARAAFARAAAIEPRPIAGGRGARALDRLDEVEAELASRPRGRAHRQTR